MRSISQWVLLLIFFISTNAMAAQKVIRWTGSEDGNGSISHIIQVLSQKLGHPLTEKDFVLQEDRDLAFNHYKRFVQVVDQIPVAGKSIRIWTELGSEKAIQVEASIQSPAQSNQALAALGKSTKALTSELDSEETMDLVRKAVIKVTDDPYVRGVDWQDEWYQDSLVRSVKVKGKRGTHHLRIDLSTQKIVSREYREFPQADLSIPVQVYPFYEEVEGEGTRLPRIASELRNLNPQVPVVSGDLYAPLRSQRYFYSKYHPLLGETEAGRAQGYWAMSYIKREAEKLRSGLPLVANDFNQGVLLQGKYATINIHPDAVKKFANLSFEPKFSSPLFPNFVEVMVDGKPTDEMLPGTAFSGKPLTSLEDAWNRPARRLPDHDPAQYLNDGFDEIQVYWGIDTLFEVLHQRGFKDPEISTRPFNAFLFNPDITYRDNAYYTDDTINFTTYSAKAGNAARDNGTVWHELGHGIMDRLMGDHIQLADTGGLSEGMADFLAAIVVQAVSKGEAFPGSDKFRIINKTGFYLTNEVHDDGEAYGGAMKDFMDAVIKERGQVGLDQVTDLVLESMRLTRDYPGLTAPEWFNHMIFADSLGREGLRQPGELKNYLLTALAGRNFRLDGGAVAAFSIVNTEGNQEVDDAAPGSRGKPIALELAKEATADFKIKASLKSSEAYAFRYPVRIQVQYNGGPLQGAVHWTGEEKGSQTYTLASDSESVEIPLQATGKCDEVNRPDGSCVDFVYLQIFNEGEAAQPVAKKRFYVRVKNPATTQPAGR